MKLTVNRAKLVKAIEAARDKARAEFEKQKAKHDKLVVVAREEYAKALEKEATDIRAGKDRVDYYEAPCRKVKWPDKPREPKDYSELLEKLALAEDVQVVVDDKSDYFRFIG